MNVDAASSAHISDRKDSGSFPAGCPKHVASIVPSSFASYYDSFASYYELY